ncbi:MAG: LTA synthase family protein [Clostridium sp.]|uniref:LTA synthase family protein n=1 Tax=Clostridium sp. TaxID=1506 RepID=UPI003F334144
MQIISYLIPGLLIGFFSYFLFEKAKTTKTLLKELLTKLVFLNVVSLSILKFLLGKPNILKASFYNTSLMIKYILFTLLLGLIYLTFKGLMFKKLHFELVTEKKNWKVILIQVFSVVFIAIGASFIFFADWFIDYFGNITPEQFLFNLHSPLKGTSTDMYVEILNTPVFSSIACILIFIIIVSFKYNISLDFKERNIKLITLKYFRIAVLIFSFIFLASGVYYGSKKLRLPEVVKSYFSDSAYIKDNYVDPRNVKMEFPKKKRNLIHIYLESVESSYLSKELGGYMDVNLMPELTTLSKEGVSFSHNDKFGGPYQTYGSSWSVASMINMGAGIPLKIPMGGNSYGKSGSFLPGAVTIGDILATEGYNQTIMFGADADFGGLTTYFGTHGDFKIFDHKYVLKEGLVPPNYDVWWGFEDDKLYGFAKQELTRLSKEGKPFNFTMETADTHFPDGYLSKHAEKKHKSQYANVISYSTKEAVEFIKWIQKQPFYENTTIVVTGDHLSMDKNFFKNWDPNYRRSVFNLILNADPTTTNKNVDRLKNREFSPVDFYPTILASMGVKIEGNRLGLGTNLYSNEKTLIERDGVKTFDTSLGEKSNFFNDTFISEDKNSTFSNKLVTYR